MRQVGGLRVNAETRLGDAANTGDGTLAVRTELELEGQLLADLCVLFLPAGDEASALRMSATRALSLL
ncbi:hypothetical protein G205_14588 [Arthrobacter nitrophenolicus]|uniref:Uncharacterized protein n=1 Tax=Arthrobacter nitrophenolicus TaxID=683150 RepID=L8TMU4_9MICC|nr:hypothetical protein G205_14588 [Arthrobacter nitrophenolicus]